jgi:LysM repeat protein
MRILRRLLPVLLVVGLSLPSAGLARADSEYIVQTGDTLFMIALKFNVSVSAITAANGLANPNLVYVGERLVIPSASAPSAPSAATSVPASGSTYSVQSGDTLFKVALKFNVGLSNLAAANGITNYNLVYVGQRLIIPGASSVPAAPTAAPAATAVPPATTRSTYVVQRGDMLGKIAQKFGLTSAVLIAANGITNPNLIYVGQSLLIPASASVPAATPLPATPVPATPVPATPAPATPTPEAATPTPAPGLPTAVAPGHLAGQIMLESNKPTYATKIEDVWFYELVQNPTGQTARFGILGINVTGPNVNYFHTSWSAPNEPDQEFTLNPGCYGPVGIPCAADSNWARHRDAVGGLPQNRPGETLTTPGQYLLEFFACYSGYKVCQTPNGSWERLGSVSIVAVDWTPPAASILSPKLLTPSPTPPAPTSLCYLLKDDPQHIQLFCNGN